MESIKITFLEASADGLRRLTTDNWAGACLIVAREHFASTHKSEELMRPGVYILVGPLKADEIHHPPRLFSQIYIGKSDRLDERLRHHHDRKEFWSTAFAFYRTSEDLYAGQIGQLESLLIERARAAGNHVVTNVATPKARRQSSQQDSMVSFAGQIESMLKALGHDFFSSRRMPLPDVTDVQEGQEVLVPLPLRSVVAHLKEICAALTATEFYGTQVPDLRAKVVHGESSRVFARIEFRSRAVKLTLRDGPRMLLDAQSALSDSVAEEIQRSHQRALLHLSE